MPGGLFCTSNHGKASAGLKAGVDEDDLVAFELGLADASQMTNVQERYKDRIKKKLQEVVVTFSSCQDDWGR